MAYLLRISFLILLHFIHSVVGQRCPSHIPNGQIDSWCYDAGSFEDLYEHMCPYSCDEGYERPTYVYLLQCTSRGKWKSSLDDNLTEEDFCTRALCPYKVPNGQLLDTCSARIGSTCEYSCVSGFQMNSKAPSVTCQHPGYWSEDVHSLCTNDQQCQDYKIAHGDLDLSCSRLAEETCVFTCHKGYFPSTTAVSWKITCEPSLSWNISLSTLCRKYEDCPITIPNGYVFSRCSRKYGSFCYSYYCNTGYIKPYREPYLRCNASAQWEWDKDRGEPCIREDILCPSNIKNGQLASLCHRQPGSICYYYCNDRCTKDPFVSRLKCGDDSRWDENTDNLCYNSFSGRCPSDIPDGYISSSCDRYLHSTCDYYCYGCSSIYPTLYCKGNGQWEYQESACNCEPEDEQEGTSLGTLIGVLIGLGVGIFLLSICIWAYQSNQKRQRNYQNAPARGQNITEPPNIEDGTQNMLPGEGRVHTNTRPSPSAPLQPQIEAFPHSDEPPDYRTLSKPEPTLDPPSYDQDQLKALKDDLKVSNKAAYASESAVGSNCSRHFPNGRVVRGCQREGDLYGHICRYSCRDGYVKDPSITLIECKASGKWSPLFGRNLTEDELCKPAWCPHNLPNGKLKDACSTRVGSTCEYFCLPGFQMNPEASNITCRPSRNWNVDLHSLCAKNQQCWKYKIANGDLDLSCRRIPEETCQFTCHTDYLPSPSTPTRRITCLSDLSWNQSLSSLCRKFENCRESIPNGKVSSLCRGEYQSYCYHYVCDDGYVKPPIQPRLRCNASGQWEWDKDRGNPCISLGVLCPLTIINGRLPWNCHRQPGAVCSYVCNRMCTKNRAVVEITCGNHSKWNKRAGLCYNCEVTTVATTTSAYHHICSSYIPNGYISYSCDRSPYTSCDYSCDHGCIDQYPTLTCMASGFWEHRERACKCQTDFDSSDQTLTIGSIIGIVAGVGVLCCILAICFSICKRQNQHNSNDQTVRYQAPSPLRTDDNEASNREDAAQSMLPSEGTFYPLSQQDNNTRLSPSAPPQADIEDQTHCVEPPDYRTLSNSERTVDPPSYEQVISDPSKFKA